MAENGWSQPEPVGDTAVSMRVEGDSAAANIDWVRGIAQAILAAAPVGMVEVVASPGRVTVAYDPLAIDGVAGFQAAIGAAAASASPTHAGAGQTHVIHVAYDGPDLDEVCAGHGIERAALVAAHTEPDYIVEALGFLPGFGYLAGLPESLATPRRPTPRRRIPAGAVGIGGGQTGIYPFASPGGWNLIGRTDATLFDPIRPRPALFAVGERVRFVPADLPPRAAAEEPSQGSTVDHAAITVLDPGLFTTVQDLGRPGHRAAGVPLSGAADSVSLRLANLLVGNPEDAAGIECTLLGPALRFERETVIALIGATFPGLASGTATRVPAGTVITLGHATLGCRGFLAVAGGIDVEPVIGSRSTLVAAGLGGLAGRPFRKGDSLAVGEPATPTSSQQLSPGLTPRHLQHDGPRVLRIIPSEHAKHGETFGSDPWSRVYRTSSRSDRMGVRLDGDPLPSPADAAGMPSVAVFPGTVQVPPDGQPIVLLADAQTIGGYPVLGQVIVADLPIAAQLRPGDDICWKVVSLAEAHAALRERETTIATMRDSLR
jgi:KipI family sensor histidine kinase inhibitor